MASDDKWSGELSYLLQEYQGGENYTQVYSATILAPTWNIVEHDLRFGYLGSYSNTDFNTYATSSKLGDVLVGGAINTFYPYFTQSNLQTHNVLLEGNLRINDRLAFAVDAQLALWGRHDDPSIKLVTDQGGSDLVQDLTRQTFRPYEMELSGSYWLANNSVLILRYVRSRNIFIRSQVIGVGFNYYIISKSE